MISTRCFALLATLWLLLVATPAAALASPASPFTIRWTAPGDDSLSGRAAIYDLRYSELPITQSNFHQATQITGLPSPGVAGTLESFEVLGLSDLVTYHIAIISADELGNWAPLSNVKTRPGQTTSVERTAPSFSSPWPNPARQSVRWTCSVAEPTQILVRVFDATGRLVRTIASGERGAGSDVLSWDLRDDRGHAVSAGVYFARARLGTMERTERLIVAR